MSHTDRLRRSELAVPAANPRMIQKAASSDADLVFLDLEDATAPALKEKARANVIQGLTTLDWGRKLRAVRVNSADTKWAADDLIEVVTNAHQHLDIIIIPKPYAPRDIWFFETLLDQLEKKLDIEPRIGFEALIEEAQALSCVEQIAASSPRLEALILGFGDLSASLGFRVGHEANPGDRYPGDPWHAARSRMIAACRANGLAPIDGPYPVFTDPDAYRRQCTWAATLGAAGKWCIHPSQIAIANDVFAPSDNEIAFARLQVDAYRKATEGGEGAAAAGGMLVDAASLRLFQAVLDRAGQCGKLG
jgi:citrate lyase subunit beta / citryl-CoA lyase